MTKKSILMISGSATQNSTNDKILEFIEQELVQEFEVLAFPDLGILPHFRTELTDLNTPPEVIALREAVEKVDGIIISTPEYVFSIPSRLKNAIEWCVSTVVFTNKPVGIITASAGGTRGHEELQMILRTIQARLSDDTCLLIPGVKGKWKRDAQQFDEPTKELLTRFLKNYRQLIIT